jgi:DNA modification methylase
MLEQVNIIYNENCLVTMARMPDDCIDLVVTSPPYDNLRTYGKDDISGSFQREFPAIAAELYRVIKQGGVMVWIVNDATIDGSETGTSFRQALHFMDAGFRLYDTMIYKKNGCPSPSNARYYPCFEYMFVLSKGKPTIINLIKDHENKHVGETVHRGNQRNCDGSIGKRKKFNEDGLRKRVQSHSIRCNIWEYSVGWMKSYSEAFLRGHPAIFPEQLAADHIISWSNPGDLVYDPFMGSGTVALVASQNWRRYVGSEIVSEYCDLAAKRMSQGMLPF